MPPVVVRSGLCLVFCALSCMRVHGGDLPDVAVPRQLSLEKAEAILIENNLTIIAAKHGVDAARAQRLIASYHPNPTLTTGAEQFSTRRLGEHNVTDNNSASNRSYTFRIDQTIETGNKRGLRMQNADYQTQASEAQVLDAVRQQVFQLRQTFYTVLLARENFKAAKDNLDSIENTEQLIRKQVKGGNISEAELTRFQVNKVQFQRDSVSAQLSYDQSIRDLLNVLGSHANESAKASGDGKTASTTVEVVGELCALSVEAAQDALREAAVLRPDVVAAQRNVDAAEKAVDMARAQRSVDVTVGGEYQRVGGDNTVGLVVSVPLPLYNNHKGNIQQAEAQLRQAKAQFTQAKLQALADVDKAFRAHQSSKELLKIYTSETLAKAKESLDILAKSYQKGAASLLDLLDAQRTYNQTRVAANQACFDFDVSIFQLEQAAGQKLSNTK